MSGRARGRSRGKPRGAAEAPVRRPGEEEPSVPPKSDQQPAPGVSRGRGRAAGAVAEPVPAVASGRSSVRGITRGEKRPGNVPEPTGEMEALSLGTGDASDVQRRPSRWVEKYTRPAHATSKEGTAGQAVNLFTNYFELESLGAQFVLYQYSVDFKPPCDSRRLRIALVKKQTEIIGSVSAFDGIVLFIPKRLEKTTVFTVKRDYDDANIQVTINFTNELAQGDPTCLQVLNVFLRRALNTIGMKQIQRHYFSPADNKKVERHKMEVWPGYATSIMQYEKSVLLCVDLVHKVLRCVTVKDQMADIYNANKGGAFSDACIKSFVGEIVLTRYNNKTYRIDDIDFTKNPNSKFVGHDGTEISFVEYYKKAYNLTITDTQQPLLFSKPKARDKRAGRDTPIYLVPELCVLCGLSEQMRSDFNVMKDLAQHTRVGPLDRYKKLGDFVNRLTANETVKQEMSDWGLKFADRLLSFTGRTLNVETIVMNSNKFGYKAEEADWSREMRGAQMISAVSLLNWTLICTQRDSAVANDLFQTLKKVGGPVGMRVELPKIFELPNDRMDSFKKALQQGVTSDTQIVMVIVPNNRKDRYDTVKKFCCLDHPVPSQVVVARTISKPKMLMSVATKIIIQMNCKLGGEVWAVEVPLKNHMVVGIDTYHEKKSASLGGFVASMNKHMTQYYSRCVVQQQGQELHDAIRPCFVASLRKYNEVNNTLPEKIFIYRDGVGDGQLPVIVDHELRQFKTVFEEVQAGWMPQIVFIVVKKRISSRFFAASGNSLLNPTPGTIVDKEVTRREWYDFFLVSQSVRQGTVTPTHYNVIYDTSGLRPDHIQRLTYKLTHLYYNWPGTIRVPAPCQYAHKLAFLVGQSIHREPSLALADRLYFL